MSLLNPVTRTIRRTAGTRWTRQFTSSSSRPRHPGVAVAVSFVVAGSTLALATRRKVHCDHEIEEDLDAFPARFQKPKWTITQYLSADQILAGGPSWWPGGAGIDRCDALTVASNYESEDYIAVYFGSKEEPDHKTYIGLFDGHNGSATSEFLSEHLIQFLQRSLDRLPQQYDHLLHSDPSYEDELVQDTIKYVFREIDQAIVDPTDVLASNSKTNAVRSLRQAYSGSCALVSVYDPDNRSLRVALTGDSRAVLGRKIKGGDGKDTYAVHVLSVDQNAHNPAEVARLNAEHPGEKVVDKGRVMGWGPSRSFGNAAYKWSVDTQKKLNERYLGDRPMDSTKTPPYLTAEPVVTSFVVKPGDFLIMGSDGLWDCLTNEEAVGLVGVWLKENGHAVPKPEKESKDKKAEDSKVYKSSDLPVKLSQKDDTVFYKWWRTEKRFVNRDKNVAAHLVRNAFGGADGDLTNALLSMTSPRSRRYRDDTSVVVTFFS
ncbi:hypothetical protein V5O48_013316 [Marasmius crinis-equi]|uniref:PPM-type phosphatase domain-containing protein n=1 Tax=Marasmius crinis-equi TaxID=585013 RepID=A0ABR3F0D8_9AGAR